VIPFDHVSGVCEEIALPDQDREESAEILQALIGNKGMVLGSFTHGCSAKPPGGTGECHWFASCGVLLVFGLIRFARFPA